MFSGDGSGDFLYPALYESGFASQPVSQSIHDGMKLTDIFISAVCRCAPPGNKPTRIEIANCRPYLEAEIGLLAGLKGIVALGKIAFDEVVHIYRWKGHQMPSIKFAHGVFIETTEGLPWLLASYHPSRQNTQTGRLTKNMFADIWERAKTEIIDPASP
jgi:uracil-DNA glycosylase family 4